MVCVCVCVCVCVEVEKEIWLLFHQLDWFCRCGQGMFEPRVDALSHMPSVEGTPAKAHFMTRSTS